MRTTRLLTVILLLSCVLRVYLAFGGGQYFWPDESRYESSQYAVYHLARGEWRPAAEDLLGHADHLLFCWFGLPAALWEHFFGPNPHIVACYFSLFSVLAIYLVWRVARCAGAGEREALLAAFLAACANSLFFYSRHFFPYDISLCCMLVALRYALGPGSWRNSLLAGVAAGTGFLTYNGYWLLGGCVLVLHVLLGEGGWRRIFARAGLAGAGLVLPLALFLILGRIAGHDLTAEFRHNAATIIQGDFHLGYRLIVEYFWQTEGGMSLFWFGGSVIALILLVRERRLCRATWWLGGAALLAGGLVLLSDVVTKFVVYGRLVRELVPFLCLATAYAVERLAELRLISRRVMAGGMMAVVGIAAWNFSGPLRQVFPDDFRRLAAKVVFQQQRQELGVYRVVFDARLWGADLHAIPPPHVVVLRRRHPLQFLPYQYEGYTRQQRRDLNTHDISMRVVRLTDTETGNAISLPHGNALWGDYPGPVRMTLSFPQTPEGQGQPIVTSGRPFVGDFLYVIPEAAGQIRFGYDDWGGRSFTTEPLHVDATRPHELLVSMGSLYPAENATQVGPPELAQLRDYLLVVLDGKTIVSRRVPYHTVSPETITFGINFIKGSTADPAFLGSITRLARAGLDEVVGRIGPLMGPAVAARRPRLWQGAMGPVRMSVALPDVPVGEAQPLLAVGRPGKGDLIFWVRDTDGRIRLGFDRSAEGVVLSAPLSVPQGHVATFLLSLGSMMPPADSQDYLDNPSNRRLREIAYAAVNGQTGLWVNRPFDGPAEGVAFAANIVGSPAAGAYFTGDVLGLNPVDPSEVLTGSLKMVSMDELRENTWQGFPGPIRLKLRFADHPLNDREPIIVSGVNGRGDFLYVLYKTPGLIRFGFDHWGSEGLFSAPIEFDQGAEHEIMLSLGALLPQDGSFYDAYPAMLLVRNFLWVTFDGREVFALPAAFYPCTPRQITFGANLIGGTTCGPTFSAQVLSVEVMPMADIRAQVLDLFLKRPGTPSPEWQGYSGPVTMKVRFPDLAPGASEPLLTTGQTGAGDSLFLRREVDGRLQLGLDHWGERHLLLSEPFEAAAGSEHSLVVSVGSLFPPAYSDFYSIHPDFRSLLETVYVELDGRPVLQGQRPAFASQLDDINYGANFIGITVTGKVFSGRIDQVKPLAAQEILQRLARVTSGLPAGAR